MPGYRRFYWKKTLELLALERGHALPSEVLAPQRAALIHLADGIKRAAG